MSDYKRFEEFFKKERKEIQRKKFVIQYTILKITSDFKVMDLLQKEIVIELTFLSRYLFPSGWYWKEALLEKEIVVAAAVILLAGSVDGLIQSEHCML